MADLVATPVLPVSLAVRNGECRLARAGCDTPRLDAELLLGETLGLDRAGLVLRADRQLTDAETGRFWTMLERREAREPVAYILGRREFRRLSLAVDRRVLIPRPETELLVEVALSLPEGVSVADVGTGSGAVALAVADERPDLRVRGLDVDPEALEVAAGNAARLGLEVDFVQADLLDGEPYEAVLANLPYVRAGAELAPEITGWEPPGALFAGQDGLDVIRRLIAQTAARAQRPAVLALEIDPDQADEVAGLISPAGFRRVQRRLDLAGRERVAVGFA